jgi:hypothetical protein
MRKSFIFMLGAWFLAFIITLTTTWQPLIIATAIIAVGSTGLWLSHLTAFALRAVGNTSKSKDKALRERDAADHSPDPRRQFVLGFAKSFILVATATALPIQAVLAQTRMNQCLACCATKLQACGNGANCNILYQNCVSNCNSQGSSPSAWRCW